MDLLQPGHCTFSRSFTPKALGLEDMYAERKVAEDPSVKGSPKGKTRVPDSEGEHNLLKEKNYKDTIYSLEQENIKLQLQNTYLTGTMDRLGLGSGSS